MTLEHDDFFVTTPIFHLDGGRRIRTSGDLGMIAVRIGDTASGAVLPDGILPADPAAAWVGRTASLEIVDGDEGRDSAGSDDSDPAGDDSGASEDEPARILWIEP